MFKKCLILTSIVFLTGCTLNPLADLESSSQTQVQGQTENRGIYPVVSRLADGSWYMGTWFEQGPYGGRIVHQTYGFWTDIRVENLSYNKTVGIVYTTNNWTTSAVAYGIYESSLGSGYEKWGVDLTKLEGGPVKYAIFTEMNGVKTWDNNGGNNYSVILQ